MMGDERKSFGRKLAFSDLVRETARSTSQPRRSPSATDHFEEGVSQQRILTKFE